MSLFVFNPFRASEELAPTQLRGQKMMSWLRVLLTPVKWLSDLFTEDYCLGSNAAYYDNAATYSLGDRVRWSDRGVYELRVTSSTGVDPTGETLSRTNWFNILKDYIGIDSRIVWNGQIIVFEEIINEFYGITSAPFIYCYETPNGSASTGLAVFIPVAFWTTLGTTNAQRQASVYGFAKNYVLGTYTFIATPY